MGGSWVYKARGQQEDILKYATVIEVCTELIKPETWRPKVVDLGCYITLSSSGLVLTMEVFIGIVPVIILAAKAT